MWRVCKCVPEPRGSGNHRARQFSSSLFDSRNEIKTDRSRAAKCSNFLTSVCIFRHNVFWNFQSLLIFPMIVAATIIDSKKSLHRPICISAIFYQFYFVCLYEISHLYLCYLMAFFVISKITKNRIFATKPRMWFRPLILWFRGNRNDYGVWTEKIVYFSILRLFHAFLMQWFWCFLYGFCSIFSGYGVFRLFSGCNLLVLFAFTVNNFILYANSTEISGFSVLLCFLRPAILPCWYCRHFTDERRLWLFQVIVSGG